MGIRLGWSRGINQVAIMDQDFNQGMEMMQPQTKKRKASKKVLIVVITVFLALAIALGVYLFTQKKPETVAPQVAQNDQAQQQKPKESVRFIASGDMIPHDAINQAAEQSDGTYEYSSMFGEMKALFDKADVRFCNQATLAGGTKYGVSGYPKFNAPTEFSRDMGELGCNVINTGSNHTNDFKQEVISASVNAWKGVPNVLAVAGANAEPSDKDIIRYFENNGVKFAFVSYTTYSNEPSPNGYSVTMYSKNLAQKQLTEARKKADIVIVSMRWGTEYSPNINAQQKTWAREVANLGADIIVGHGPHVLEPAEVITLDDGRKSYVWYSLGNFFNAQLDPESLFNGIAVMDIDISTKKITNVAYLPIYMHYEWSAADKTAGKLLARKNFSMYTFEDGQAALEKSQNNTTFEEQRQRIESTLNKLTQIKLLTKDQYIQS